MAREGERLRALESKVPRNRQRISGGDPSGGGIIKGTALNRPINRCRTKGSCIPEIERTGREHRTKRERGRTRHRRRRVLIQRDAGTGLNRSDVGTGRNVRAGNGHTNEEARRRRVRNDRSTHRVSTRGRTGRSGEGVSVIKIKGTRGVNV